MLWTLKNLVESSNSTHIEIDGRWVPFRPINWKWRNLKERITDAWAVFTGKADTFTWPAGQ